MIDKLLEIMVGIWWEKIPELLSTLFLFRKIRNVQNCYTLLLFTLLESQTFKVIAGRGNYSIAEQQDVTLLLEFKILALKIQFLTISKSV